MALRAIARVVTVLALAASAVPYSPSRLLQVDATLPLNARTTATTGTVERNRQSYQYPGLTKSTQGLKQHSAP